MSGRRTSFFVYCDATYSNFALFQVGVPKRYNFAVLHDALAYAQILAAGDIQVTIFNVQGDIIIRDAVLQPFAGGASGAIEDAISSADRPSEGRLHHLSLAGQH